MSAHHHQESLSSETSTGGGALPRISAVVRATRRIIADGQWFGRVILSSGQRFYWDNGFSRAASLAYTTLLSLVPLTVLIFGLFGSLVSSSDMSLVRTFLFQQFVPNLDISEFQEVFDTFQSASQAISGLNALVFASVVITAVLLINSIEFAMNEVWQVYEPRPLGNRIAIFCAIIVMSPVLAISAYHFNSFRVEPVLSAMGDDSGWVSSWSYFASIYYTLVPYIIDFLAFAGLYYLVPKAPVWKRSAIFGAVLAALLFNIAKSGFALYISHAAQSYRALYTTIAAVPIFLFWLYLAWAIVLFGAELCYQAQHLPRHGRLHRRSFLSVGDGGFMLAMEALFLLAWSFERGERAPNELEVAERLGCSTTVLKPALFALHRAGIIGRGDSRDMPLLLMRSPHTITLGEIEGALGVERIEGHATARYAREFERAFAALARPQGGHDVTLAEVLGATGSQ